LRSSRLRISFAICSASVDFPAPGSPAITVMVFSGSPEERFSSIGVLKNLSSGVSISSSERIKSGSFTFSSVKNPAQKRHLVVKFG